jgi:hypothetical protein
LIARAMLEGELRACTMKQCAEFAALFWKPDEARQP